MLSVLLCIEKWEKRTSCLRFGCLLPSTAVLCVTYVDFFGPVVGFGMDGFSTPVGGRCPGGGGDLSFIWHAT